MIRKRSIFSLLLFLACLLPLTAWDQSVFPNRLPRLPEDNREYLDLLRARSEYGSQVEEELAGLLESDVSENTRFYLRQALRELPRATEPRLRETVERISRHRPVNGLDLDRLFRLEEGLIRTNRRLGLLEDIYRYADRPDDYPVDSAREDIRTEIRFYGIRNGDRLGEIGAGNERFATAVATMFDDLTFFVNELDTTALLRIGYHLAYHPVFAGPERRFSAVRGREGSCGLEGAGLDKVIVRNAFHHFDRPEEMLLSIRQSLGPGGALYLKEKFAEECAVGCCDRLIQEEEIMLLMKKAGFHLAERLPVFPEGEERWWLLKFELQPE